MNRATLLLLFALAPTIAQADQAAGDACAASLSPDAKMIYDAAAPGFAAAADARGEVREQVMALVKAGKIKKDGARDEAKAAAPCLRKLR